MSIVLVLSKKTTTSRARLVRTMRVCRRVANMRNRNIPEDQYDGGRQQVDASVCFSTHTLCSCCAAGE